MAVGCVKSVPDLPSGRPHDFEYDPLFLVSGPRDHFKAAMLARMSTAKYQICPIFANMFSDLPNHPRKQYVRRQIAPLPPAIRAQKARMVKNDLPIRKPDVVGVDRYKYFHFPNIIEPKIPPLQLQFVEKKIIKPDPKIKKKKVQTVFRESSAQTSPWEPPYFVTGSGDTTPELLKLDFLKWGSTLPVGVHEVELLERARMKRRWLATCDVKTEEDLEKRKIIIAALERDEWAYREQEIQDIQDLRFKLLEKMLNELHAKAINRNEQKLKMFASRRISEKDKKLQELQKKMQRGKK